MKRRIEPEWENLIDFKQIYLIDFFNETIYLMQINI